MSRGLKQDIIDAKIETLKLSGATEKAIFEAQKNGSPVEIEAEIMKEAIVNFLTKAEFRVTKLNAPITVEELNSPPLSVNIELETLLGDKAPILETLKKVGNLIPGVGQVVDELVNQLEDAIKQAINPLLEGGAKLPFQIGKAVGGLQSKGYVNIGEDPDSVDNFDVDDEDGQRNFTTVKLIRDDIEDLL